ncbi:MAG: peptidase MA family metallohydrolase [Myxococcales bacterium]
MSAALLALALFGAPSGPAETGDDGLLRAAFTEAQDKLEQWDVPAARRIAEDMVARVGKNVITDELLGRVRFFEGDYAGAAELLADSSSEYGKLAKASLAEIKDYDHRESDHFALWFPKGRDGILVPYALDTLEKAYRAIGGDLHEQPPGRIRVEILRDAAALARLSPLTEKEIETSGTIALCKFNKLMVTSPEALLTGYAWQDTLAHELTHYLISRRSENTVPIWLHEGIAKFEETRWRGPPGRALSPAAAALLSRRLREGRLITFAQMHPSMALLPSQEDAALAFAEVFTAVKFLYEQKGGEAALNALLDKLRAGESDSRAVAEVAGEPFAAFQSDWKAYLRRQPAPKEALPLVAEKLRFKHPKQGKGDEAAPAVPDALGDEIDDGPARRFAHLGELLRLRRRASASAIEFAKAEARVGARSPQLSNKYALALIEIGQSRKAGDLLRASLEPFPEIAETHLHLGEVLLAEQRWAEARGELLAANAIDPFDPEIHVGLMKADHALGDQAAYGIEARAVALLTAH